MGAATDYSVQSCTAIFYKAQTLQLHPNLDRFGEAVAEEAAPPPAPIVDPADSGSSAWDSEPSTAVELDNTYEIVTSCQGRLPTTTLRVVKAAPKDGTPATEIMEGQEFKLFIVGY